MTANKIWEIVDHQIKEFKGTYQEWVEWNERMAAKENMNAEVRKTKEENPKTETKIFRPEPQTTNNKPQPTNGTPINRDLQRELQKQQRRLSNLEVDITKASNEKERLEVAMAQPENFSDRKKFIALEEDYVKAKVALASLNKEYEALFEKVMELESQAI
jgi:ATP-binding cassette subfamily F protein 3